MLTSLLLAAILAPMPAGVRAQKQAPLVVIMAAAVPITDISWSTLRRAFLGEMAEYQSGKRLIPFNAPPGAIARVIFDKRVLNLSADEVGRFWVDRRIRDEGAPPRTVPTHELAVRVAAGVAGAITYVPADVPMKGVRILTIDGRSAGSPGYLLNP
jgi:hypothetical protein